MVETPKDAGSFYAAIFGNKNRKRSVSNACGCFEMVEVNTIHSYSSLNRSVRSGIREKIEELLFYHFGQVNFP